MSAPRSRFRILLWCLVALTVAVGAAPSRTQAQTPAPSAAPKFVLKPVDQAGPYFALTLEAGTDESLAVDLGNAGTEPVAARTYAADVYTLVNGGFGVRDEDSSTGTTTWLDYPAETLHLPPRQMIERKFTIHAPEGTAPGQYIAALVLQTAEPIAVSGTEMLRQRIVTSIAVFITVPGPLTPKLEIGQASLNQASERNVLQIEVSNPGNVLLKPAGTVTVTNDAGEAVVTAPIQMRSVYADSATTIEIPIPATVAPGKYAVSVTLADEETGVEASASDLSLDLSASADATPVAAPLAIDAVTIEPSRDAATNNLRFINVSVLLSNTGESVNGARLIMHVTRDGALVENFPLSESLLVPRGTTEVRQRYLPMDEWVPGTYAFSIILEAVDVRSGQSTILATADAPTTITVP
jgi:hypothetical protein